MLLSFVFHTGILHKIVWPKDSAAKKHLKTTPQPKEKEILPLFDSSRWTPIEPTINPDFKILEIINSTAE